ncbi:MAG: T9SS type A sorting domain-containing protein [Prevotella sp.]|jgi:hypothetical protein|nr:T9SS type A sorting domain-containing protein [Prevotella sp.]
MKQLKHKALLALMFCMIPWISIHTEIPKTTENQNNWRERKRISSDRVRPTRTGNFHDALINLVNVEKGYDYWETLRFDVTAGAYEINVILACSDEFEIDLSSDHPDFEFKPLYPSVTIPENMVSAFQSYGKVYGIHDVGVYVYTIKGIATGDQSYNISLQYTPEHNGYVWSFYYGSAERGRPVRWLVDPWVNTNNRIVLPYKNLSIDYIIVTAQHREVSTDFWPSSSIEGDWSFSLHDLSKKGENIVNPYRHSNTTDKYYLGTGHKIHPGIYKYHLSAVSSSSSWDAGAYADLYTRTLDEEYYKPKVPYFDRSNYDPNDDDDDIYNPTPLKFSYDAAGNLTKREIELLPKSAFAQQNQNLEQKTLSDKVATRDITIYPNPTYGQLAIEFSSIEGVKNADITILNFNGSIVLKKKIDSQYMDLDISNRPPGIYFMHIQIDGEVTRWKVIKK